MGQLGSPPPLRASLPPPALRALTPRPLQPEAARAPSQREPSLVILSRQLLQTVRRPMPGGRSRPPLPPSRARLAGQGSPQKRASADVTDYYVPISPSYAQAKVLAAATARDGDWASELEGITNRKAHARGLLIGLSVAVACSLALLLQHG